MIKQLLVVVDPTSDRQPAIGRAAWLAGQCGASVELFICDYDQYLASERDYFDSVALEAARRKLIEGHLHSLRKQARKLEKQGLAVTVDARWDHPLHEGIERKVQEAKPDIVFKDTHYHAALRRSIFSNTDWNLIRGCSAPLWLVKPHDFASRPRIVAAVDPLHEHDKPAALDHRIAIAALALRDATGADLQLVHSYEIAPALAVSADSLVMPISAPVRDLAEAIRKQHTDAVLALASRHGISSEETRVQEGPTRQVLIRLTDQLSTDLVVLGAVSRSGLKRLFLGSTAEEILDRLGCDMLLVRPAGDWPLMASR